jgi:hypothetical protein
MKEELNKYRAYFNDHLLKVRLIQRKLDKELLEELTLEDRETMRAIYELHLNEEKSVIEEN